MNLYELCNEISSYISGRFNENNMDMLKLFTSENIIFMIRQKNVSQLEFILGSCKSLESHDLLEQLHFYTRLDLL